jgi:hypothetical protein
LDVGPGQGAGADDDVRAGLENGPEFFELLDRGRKVGVGEQDEVPFGRQNASADGVSLASSARRRVSSPLPSSTTRISAGHGRDRRYSARWPTVRPILSSSLKAGTTTERCGRLKGWLE